jgi:hypothetical protein
VKTCLRKLLSHLASCVVFRICFPLYPFQISLAGELRKSCLVAAPLRALAMQSIGQKRMLRSVDHSLSSTRRKSRSATHRTRVSAGARVTCSKRVYQTCVMIGYALQEFDAWLKHALDQSLTRPGSSRCCCISGPPGCGRSTTIRILANVHPRQAPMFISAR